MVKILRLFIFLLILVLAIVANNYYFKTKWYSFIGLFLMVWLVYSLISNFVIKFYKNKKGIAQEKYSYAFPDSMAKFMKVMDTRTQIESALLSMLFILVGMIALDIYIVFFMNFDWWFKGLILFNSLCGFAFLLTTLIGQYQAYVSYMQTVETLSNFDDKGYLTLNQMKGGQ